MADESVAPEWRVVPDYPDYEVSDQGELRIILAYVRKRYSGSFPGKILKGCISPMNQTRSDGTIASYPRLVSPLINKDGKILFLRHRIVARAFLGPCPSPKHEVAHLNGNGLDNRAVNLMWATHAENCHQAIAHGTSQRGIKTHFAKLNESEVMEIKGLITYGIAIREIAYRYDVSETAIFLIKKGKTWKHLL